MVFDFLSITSALYALSIYSQLPDPSTVPGLMLFPLLANNGLEPGWRGMFVVGMAGTILSAGVGYALVSGSSLGRDLVAKFRQTEDDVSQVKWMRAGVILALVAAAVLAASLQSVVAIWYLWAGAIVGALLVPTALAYLRPQAWTGRAQLAALIAGSVVGFGLLIFGQMKVDPYVTVQLGSEAVGLGTLVPALVASSLAGFVANRRT
jgi:SSS family solute:Na+ symporter